MKIRVLGEVKGQAEEIIDHFVLKSRPLRHTYRMHGKSRLAGETAKDQNMPYHHHPTPAPKNPQWLHLDNMVTANEK